MASLLASKLQLLLPLTLLLLFTYQPTTAREYRVGGDDGWDIGVNYLSWSEQYRFSTGDVLVFSYVKGQHNVYHVMEEAFRSCNTTKGVIKTYASGNDRIELSNATTLYFICNIKGHCQGGMRLRITAERTAASGGAPTLLSSPPPMSPSPSQPSVPPHGNDVSGGASGIWVPTLMLTLIFHVMLGF
ncbi:hypothetical protein HPP92_006997 [Vanilla planifolia]|uniref:Phytocyanin domain-containing protein n=1 Tax=Vanilla planifolia TaxID=51239 RepID=A0A835V7A5_VANPL|nr:hypothetical protein HPP92_007240 [Vanilla planifolia]KAG0490134.1 hypothetical protein HPP92_006997 [Vanilla planifolia]